MYFTATVLNPRFNGCVERLSVAIDWRWAVLRENSHTFFFLFFFDESKGNEEMIVIYRYTLNREEFGSLHHYLILMDSQLVFLPAIHHQKQDFQSRFLWFDHWFFLFFVCPSIYQSTTIIHESILSFLSYNYVICLVYKNRWSTLLIPGTHWGFGSNSIAFLENAL